MSINPVDLYSFKTTEFDLISNESCINDDKLINWFWAPDKNLVNKLESDLNKKNISTNIIDVGCGFGNAMFPKLTHILGKDLKYNPNNLNFIDFDLDFDKFLFNDNYFNFVYCRHTLEDIQNPQNAFAEITRVGKQGYIETPSPLIEITKSADQSNLRGYVHHRYIVWSDITTNTLFFLPKYPLIESLDFNAGMTKKINHILNNYSIYWNNYYTWDESNKPNIVVYRNEIKCNICTDYANLLNTALDKSMEYTNHFIKNTIQK